MHCRGDYCQFFAYSAMSTISIRLKPLNRPELRRAQPAPGQLAEPGSAAGVVQSCLDHVHMASHHACRFLGPYNLRDGVLTVRRRALPPDSPALGDWRNRAPLLVLGSHAWNKPNKAGRLACGPERQARILHGASHGCARRSKHLPWALLCCRGEAERQAQVVMGLRAGAQGFEALSWAQFLTWGRVGQARGFQGATLGVAGGSSAHGEEPIRDLEPGDW